MFKTQNPRNHNLNFVFSVKLHIKNLQAPSDEKLVIAPIAKRGARSVLFAGFVSFPSDFGVEEKVIVLVGDIIGGLSVQGFGD